jgi:Plasmid pRiA4b ORF-3-like protein
MMARHITFGWSLGDGHISHALALSIGGRIDYVYDFGDDWQHQIVLEKTLVPTPESVYPACIAGERNSPPEDVGGIDGYAEFLEAIADPEHEEHEAMLNRVSEHFDPDAFSVTEVNEHLRRRLRLGEKR